MPPSSADHCRFLPSAAENGSGFGPFWVQCRALINASKRYSLTRCEEGGRTPLDLPWTKLDRESAGGCSGSRGVPRNRCCPRRTAQWRSHGCPRCAPTGSRVHHRASGTAAGQVSQQSRGCRDDNIDLLFAKKLNKCGGPRLLIAIWPSPGKWTPGFIRLWVSVWHYGWCWFCWCRFS